MPTVLSAPLCTGCGTRPDPTWSAMLSTCGRYATASVNGGARLASQPQRRIKARRWNVIPRTECDVNCVNGFPNGCACTILNGLHQAEIKMVQRVALALQGGGSPIHPS